MGQKITQSSRIDEQVLFTFLGIGILSIIILGFRYTTRETCLPIRILVTNEIVQGVVAGLRAETKEGKTFSWNFGDGETANEQTPAVTHIYKSPGKYTVSVLVNETCTELTDIIVKQAPRSTYANLQPKIRSLDSVYVNTKVQFSDDAITSVSWDWDFGEPNATANAKTAFYTYTTPGQKRVYLRVNGRSDLTDSKLIYVREPEKKVEVKPKQEYKRPDLNVKNDPVAPPIAVPHIEEEKKPVEPPPVVKAPDAPPGLLESIFMDVPNGTNWADRISKYVGGDLTIPVIYDKRTMTLTQFCEELKKIKQKKIKKITVIPSISKQTNCITSLNISIDKKSFLGL